MRLPAERGGWWHDFVCPVHGIELEHDGLLSGTFPDGGARCRYGCRPDTAKIRGAWTVLAHQACAREILRLASADPAAAVRWLTAYAERYSALSGEHDGAPSWMLRGRLFQQALTEAIWAVTIGRAAWRLMDGGTDPGDAVRALLEALADAALAARTLLVEDGRFTSNYVAWLDAAGAVCSRKPDWLDGPHGLYEHLLASTYPDGWQWEASTYYHTFVLRAAVLAIAGVPGAEPPARVRERITAMHDVLGTLRTGPLTSAGLPALHDGPYVRAGYDTELADLTPGAAARAGVRVFEHAGYAVLRGHGITAVADFGAHGGSHGHRDKLALYLYGAGVAWQPDPGQVPYGHAGWRRYFAGTAAHPAYSVDGLEQAECTGRLAGLTDDSVTVACDTAYDGVTAQRRLTLTGDGLHDELTVRCDTPRRITAQLRPAVALDVRTTGTGATTSWAGSLTGRHECDVPAEFAVRPGPGPADDPQRVVSQIDWTAYDATAAVFGSTYRIGG